MESKQSPPKDEMPQPESPKLPYETPKLTEFGSLVELTGGGEGTKSEVAPSVFTGGAGF